MIPTYILTNDNHLWLLNGFSYLWNKHCGLPVTIYGFDSPGNLFPNFEFKSLGKQLPAEKWSDGLLMMLDDIENDYFILMLEDYWLYEGINQWYFDEMDDLIYSQGNDFLRIDLSGNRASYASSRLATHFLGGVVAHWGICKIVETPEGTPYQMSFQAAIWHKENMRSVLEKDENPWQAEINGSKRVGNLRVLGTNPALMKYQPVWRSQQQHWQLDKLKTDDLEFIKRRGWLDVPEG